MAASSASARTGSACSVPQFSGGVMADYTWLPSEISNILMSKLYLLSLVNLNSCSIFETSSVILYIYYNLCRKTVWNNPWCQDQSHPMLTLRQTFFYRERHTASKAIINSSNDLSIWGTTYFKDALKSSCVIANFQQWKISKTRNSH